MSNFSVAGTLHEFRVPQASSPVAATEPIAPVWLAAYTTPRHEKTVARYFQSRAVEHFLPLYKTVRRWKNGCKVEVEFPVFPNYLFVRIDRRLAGRLLDVPGLLAFVSCGRSPVAIPDQEIELLRTELPKRRFERHPYLAVGSKARIISGPMAGTVGILVRRKNSLRVVLSVEAIRQSIAVEVDDDEVEPMR
ncbi:MAG TPA: UpxY family transcription antiterminator [Candidatus Bathyarchaeia archaeon]|nr:UpxY family transcription antiterminator [Candidatus Bathyarchaeia archaeon]